MGIVGKKIIETLKAVTISVAIGYGIALAFIFLRNNDMDLFYKIEIFSNKHLGILPTKILGWGIISLAIFLIRGVIFSLGAKLFGVLIEPFNLLAAMIIFRKKQGFFKVIHKYQYKSALDTDIYLHYNFRALWNLTMSNGSGYSFGTNRDETLSSAIGRKKIERTLSGIGPFFHFLLKVIDYTAWSEWKKGGHCYKAYQSYMNKK